jgi:hypothetical protein
VAAACLTFVTLAGCGSGDKTPAAAAAGLKSHKSKALASKPGEEKIGDMVSAVSAAKPGPPVELKFSLSGRPEVGQVMEVNIALIPRAPLPENFEASFSAAEGLEIVDGAELETVDKLVDGQAVRHVVKVLPKRDGIFALGAIVTFSQDNHDVQRTFSIPVIAGEGLAQQVAKSP